MVCYRAEESLRLETLLIFLISHPWNARCSHVRAPIVQCEAIAPDLRWETSVLLPSAY